jgi:hypothetical protein
LLTLAEIVEAESILNHFVGEIDLASFGVLNEAVSFVVVVGHETRAKDASLLGQMN